MALLNIKNFLEKFNFSPPSSKALEKELADILEKMFVFSEQDYNIKVKEPTVFISSSDSALKNELFLNQGRILSQLKNKFPTRAFRRIQFTS